MQQQLNEVIREGVSKINLLLRNAHPPDYNEEGGGGSVVNIISTPDDEKTKRRRHKGTTYGMVSPKNHVGDGNDALSFPLEDAGQNHREDNSTRSKPASNAETISDDKTRSEREHVVLDNGNNQGDGFGLTSVFQGIVTKQSDFLFGPSSNDKTDDSAQKGLESSMTAEDNGKNAGTDDRMNSEDVSHSKELESHPNVTEINTRKSTFYSYNSKDTSLIKDQQEITDSTKASSITTCLSGKDTSHVPVNVDTDPPQRILTPSQEKLKSYLQDYLSSLEKKD